MIHILGKGHNINYLGMIHYSKLAKFVQLLKTPLQNLVIAQDCWFLQ